MLIQVWSTSGKRNETKACYLWDYDRVRVRAKPFFTFPSFSTIWFQQVKGLIPMNYYGRCTVLGFCLTTERDSSAIIANELMHPCGQTAGTKKFQVLTDTGAHYSSQYFVTGKETIPGTSINWCWICAIKTFTEFRAETSTWTPQGLKEEPILHQFRKKIYVNHSPK